MAVALFLFNTGQAQSDYKRWAIEVDGGGTYPSMDVSGQFAPFGQAGIRYNISKYLGVKADFGIGQLSGGDDDFNREFTNEYMRYGLKGYLNIGRMANLHKTTEAINLMFNVGFTRIHTEITDGQNLNYDGFVNKDLESAERDYTSPYKNFTSEDLATSFGGLVQFNVSNTIAINLGATYYLATDADLMDGFSADIVANNYDDRYLSSHLGVSIYLGSGDKHADWSTPGKSKELKENTESNQKAIQNMDEKLNDTDNDGVVDAIDQDNATKDDVRVTTKGVPMDTDYDGVPDHLDDCPVTKGTKENNGCPPDSVKRQSRGQGAAQGRAGQGQGGTGDQAGQGGQQQGQQGGDRRGTGSQGQASDRRGTGTGSGEETEKDLSKDSDYPRREYSKEEVENYPVVTLESSKDASQVDEFYIVGGSFNVKSNAIDFNKYLESEGFSSMILFVEEENLFRVAFQKFNNEEDARNKLDEIRTKFNPSAWLLMQ